MKIPGMEKDIPGVRELFQRGFGASEDAIKKTKTVVGYANAATAAITLALRIASLNIVGIQDPDPLVRTKGATSNGNEGTITWALSIIPADEVLDGNDFDNCFTSFVMSEFGVTRQTSAWGESERRWTFL